MLYQLLGVYIFSLLVHALKKEELKCLLLEAEEGAEYNPTYHTPICTVIIIIMFGEFLCTYNVALMFRFTHTFC